MNPLVNRLSAWATNWHPENDVPELLAAQFESSTVRTFNDGTFYIAVGTK